MGIYHCTYHAKCKNFKWPKPFQLKAAEQRERIELHGHLANHSNMTFQSDLLNWHTKPFHTLCQDTATKHISSVHQTAYWKFFLKKDKTINNCVIMEKTCRCTDLHWTHSCCERKRTTFGNTTKQLLWMIKSWRKKKTWKSNSIISINIVAVLLSMRWDDYFLRN